MRNFSLNSNLSLRTRGKLALIATFIMVNAVALYEKYKEEEK